MSFIRIKGKTRLEHFPVTVSTALSAGSLVEWTSGYIAAADDNEAAADCVGVLVKAIAATDDDYAVARLVAVEVPVEKHVQWLADTGDTYVAATHRGVECGIIDSVTLDLDDTTNDVFCVLGAGQNDKEVVGYLKIGGSY